MIFKKLIKNAAEEKDIKLIKGWKDDYGNTIAVFEISGKKYGFIKMNGEWFYFLGIGSNRQTGEMPAGRGEYLTAQRVVGSDSNLLSLIVQKSQIPFTKLNNRTGSSWAPKDEGQKRGLAKLINDVSAINNYLSQTGILYTGGDKLIFGDDITVDDILNWKIPVKSDSINKEYAAQRALQDQKSESGKGYSVAKGNTAEVQAIIPAISAAFSQEFGRALTIGSTYRDSYNQALAMRYPLKYGDYDRLYSHMGEDAKRIKNLISRGDEEGLREAAKIIEGTPLAKGSHMAGKAIDIPFSSNRLSGADYNKFSAMISRVSQQTGIKARLNSEKKSHFHIEVG